MTKTLNTIITYPRLIVYVLSKHQKPLSKNEIVDLAKEAVFYNKSIQFQLKNNAIIHNNNIRYIDKFTKNIKSDLAIFARCRDENYNNRIKYKNDKKKIKQCERFANYKSDDGRMVDYNYQSKQFEMKFFTNT